MFVIKSSEVSGYVWMISLSSSCIIKFNLSLINIHSSISMFPDNYHIDMFFLNIIQVEQILGNLQKQKLETEAEILKN